jgi:subtilase family serine protease
VPSSIADYFGSAGGRAVPDVALVGDPNTGMLVGQTQAFPDGSYYDEYRIGGTSLASPLFAGFLALAGQAAGGSLGFVNPALYGLAGTTAFRDVSGHPPVAAVARVDYANSIDAADGLTTSLRFLNQTQSISIRPGYDDVTGLGTPNGASFITALGS